MKPQILVIKLGALGDFIMAMGPAAAIRVHHPQAHITLLTTRPYAALGEAAPYFDEVWIDSRPSLTSSPLGVWRLRQRLRSRKFQRIYDLQTSDRSSFYYHLMRPGALPEWSGIARGASHPHANQDRDFLHTIERQREQLRFAGIHHVPAPELSWLTADLSRFPLTPSQAVLLVPGGSPHRPEKRWPVAGFMQLSRLILERNLQPVLLGGDSETLLGAEIMASLPQAINLIGQTSFAEIASLAHAARAAIGNDTGPMHLIAAAGCPATVLFSGASDPALTRPRGPAVTVLQRQRLSDLDVTEVAATLPSA